MRPTKNEFLEFFHFNKKNNDISQLSLYRLNKFKSYHFKKISFCRH
jgi:hypothetical protein